MMGVDLAVALLRATVRFLLRGIDHLFHWHVQAKPLGPILMVGHARHRGSTKVFADGTEIVDGDVIGSFHLNNLVAAGLTGRSARAAALQFAKQLRESLEIMALKARDDPVFSQYKVYRSVTWIPPHGARVGFVSEPLPPGLRRSLLAAFFRVVIWGIAPAEETRMLARLEPTTYWLTRKELIRQFSKEEEELSGTPS
jgi:hypothetical protein|tara:strand:+ start:18222 stop:18815 length:594 start_codon:yes stop_codon:yes gene_type:complete